MAAFLLLIQTALAGFAKAPYLQHPADSSIVVRWETQELAPGRVVYGLSTACEQEVVQPDTTIDHELTLPGLVPDTLYYYRAISGPDTSTTAAFRSRRLPGTGFRFIVFGDPHGDSTTNQRVADRMAQVNPEPAFVTSTGDLTGNGRSASWRVFFNNQRPLLCRAPLFSAPGNHDYDSIANWFRFMAQPGNELYFTVRTGNAAFHCLDVYQQFTPGSVQYNWLLGELEQDSADADIRHIFVLAHTPPYTTNTVYSGNSLIQEHLCPLFERFGVRLFFSGHVHAYEHSLVNGVHYITTGGGGATLATSWNQARPWTVYREATYEFLVVDIDGETVISRGVRPDGSEFDTLVLVSTGVAEAPRRLRGEPALFCTPNPFRASAVISLPSAAPAMVRIYDSSGRLAPFAVEPGPTPDRIVVRSLNCIPGAYFCVVEAGVRRTVLPLLLLP
ncbi:MAG: metallophosphoesterase [candidate division WOR-3 bacterium]